MKISSHNRLNGYLIKKLLILGSYLLIVSACDSGSGSDSKNSIDSYAELDVSISGTRYQLTSTDVLAAGDGTEFNIFIGSNTNPSLPNDQLRFFLRVDLFGFDPNNGIPSGTTIDLSKPQSEYNFGVNSVVSSPTNTAKENLQSRNYQTQVGRGGDFWQPGSQGTALIKQFTVPNGFANTNTDAFRQAIRFDIELSDVNLPAFTTPTGNGPLNFPKSITIHYAKFCKVNGVCEPKNQPLKLTGEYSGGPVTVVSSNCLDSADDGPYTLSNSSLNITEHFANQFKATVIAQDIVDGFSIVATEELTGTVTDSNLSGTLIDTFTIDGEVLSGGSGTFTGTVNGDNITINFKGQDTLGDTCSWTANTSFTKI